MSNELTHPNVTIEIPDHDGRVDDLLKAQQWDSAWKILKSVDPSSISAQRDPNGLSVRASWEMGPDGHTEPAAGNCLPPSDRYLRLDRALGNARAIEHVGRIQEAVNVVHRAFDEAFRDDGFVEANQWLENVDVDREGLDMLLSLLTATLAGRSKLAARSAFYLDVERSLRSRGFLEPGLLDGLE